MSTQVGDFFRFLPSIFTMELIGTNIRKQFLTKALIKPSML